MTTNPSALQLQAGFAKLRERYRQTSASNIIAMEQLGHQLAQHPSAPEVIEALRRELHRFHGTAGTYGFADASHTAEILGRHAIQWAQDPTLDLLRRSQIILQGVADIRSAMEREGDGTVPSGESTVSTATLTRSAPLSPAPTQGAVPNAPKAPEANAEQPPEVIIVEDDAALADMLEYAMGVAGVRFKTYTDGINAVEALLAMPLNGTRPVVLLDVNLPGVDGHSLNERLRVERPGAFAVVFVTVRSSESDQVRAIRSGAIDYLAKPINLRILLAKLPMWLGRPLPTS